MKQIVSDRIIIFFIAVIVLVEIKFDFTEKMAGDFLKWNNHKRQKLGRMWNVERQNVTAMGQLSELIIEKEEKRKRIENLTNIVKPDKHSLNNEIDIQKSC